MYTVPDQISILGQDGETLSLQELRYRLKVSVICFATHPLWIGDDRGLKVGGRCLGWRRRGIA